MHPSTDSSYVKWLEDELDALKERHDMLVMESREAADVMTKHIYPKPDVPEDHPWRVLQRLQKALAEEES